MMRRRRSERRSLHDSRALHGEPRKRFFFVLEKTGIGGGPDAPADRDHFGGGDRAFHVGRLVEKTSPTQAFVPPFFLGWVWPIAAAAEKKLGLFPFISQATAS